MLRQTLRWRCKHRGNGPSDVVQADENDASDLDGEDDDVVEDLHEHVDDRHDNKVDVYYDDDDVLKINPAVDRRADGYLLEKQQQWQRAEQTWMPCRPLAV
jgi:hypothetical protein